MQDGPRAPHSHSREQAGQNQNQDDERKNVARRSLHEGVDGLANRVRLDE